MSKLPDFMEEKTIEDMPVGTVGYTVPRALGVNNDKDLFIRGDYTAEEQSAGTATMRIKRIEGGVEVSLKSIINEKYSTSEYLAPFYNLFVELVE